MKIKIKKLHPDAKIPSYAHDEDAGMDVYSNENIVIKPKHRVLVRTGISIEFPKDYVALVWDKSSMAKKGIHSMSGVGDSGFRGEYKLVLLNVGSKKYKIKKGDKIAQILVQKVERPKIEVVDELSASSRGSGSFGSTGIR
jgi:dUTP pyrophosphatase